MNEQSKLVEKVKNYFPKINADNINKAYIFGKKAHGSQKRASGDPFFSHPFEVANILAQMKLDENSIITGLLHDVIEDTLATKEELKRNRRHETNCTRDVVEHVEKFGGIQN